MTNQICPLLKVKDYTMGFKAGLQMSGFEDKQIQWLGTNEQFNALEENQKANLIDNLTSEQEEKLRDIHAKDYAGTDDDMPDDFDNWLVEKSYQELIHLLK